MTAKVGPYLFEQVRFYPYRDELDLVTGENGLAIMDYETSDGDRWFVPDNDATEFTGIEIEDVRRRVGQGLTVELPTGERVQVEGIEGVLETGNAD